MKNVLLERGPAALEMQVHLAHSAPPEQTDPEIDRLVREIIGRVADKWTMIILEALEERGVVRFSEISRMIDGISQKMLTKTIRQMECDGLVTRTVYPVIPPRVEYELTPLGRSLGAAFCGVWIWAEKNHAEIMQARRNFRDQIAIATDTPRNPADGPL